MDLIIEIDMISPLHLIVRSFQTAQVVLGKSGIPIHFLKKYPLRNVDCRRLCVPS